jgi:SAM-dependent methyltransferase
MERDNRQMQNDTPEGDALRTYETISDTWIERSEKIDIKLLYKPVMDLLPAPPASVLDIGAGTGRDAAWLAGLGYRVTAAEPSSRLRASGQLLHADEPISWVDAGLPDLAGVNGLEGYDLQVLIGVWQHVPVRDRGGSMQRLFALSARGGRVVLSLRHGPGAPGRPVFAIDAGETEDLARREGFEVLRRVLLPSIQPWNRENGVEWTWLVLERLCR